MSESSIEKSSAPDPKGEVRTMALMREISISRSGPLPDPEALRAYNEIIPGGAERILRMAETQLTHRIEIESHTIQSQQGQSSRGQIFAFLVAVLCIACATYAAITGHDAFACVLGGTTVVSLAGVFVVAKYQAKASLESKRPPPPPAQSQTVKGRKKR